MRTRHAHRKLELIALASVAMLASCHAWGFFRPVDLQPTESNVTADGVRWKDLDVGDGKEVVAGSRVSVNYTGWLEHGAKFDSSYDRGVPFEFVVGSNAVIRGWDESMPGMRVGGKRRITVPPSLAYGSEGRAGVIPPNATLVIEVELLDVL